MSETKEKILQTSLMLFAKDGYEAVSVSQIAQELGITKGALYRHYQSKRDIFEQILNRMRQLDAEGAEAFELPEGTLEEMEESYQAASIHNILAYSEAQFRYWTEQPFPAAFRRMLSLEQYRSAEMSALYQQYLSGGPVGYLSDLFASLLPKEQAAAAPNLALELYGPLYILYNIYDGAEDKAAILPLVRQHLQRFRDKWLELTAEPQV